MEKFATTLTGKTILGSAVHLAKKLSTNLKKAKLNYLLINSDFSLTQLLYPLIVL